MVGGGGGGGGGSGGKIRKTDEDFSAKNASGIISACNIFPA